MFTDVFGSEVGLNYIPITHSLHSEFSKVEDSFPGDNDLRTKLLILYAAVQKNIALSDFVDAMKPLKGIEDYALMDFLTNFRSGSKGFETSVVLADFKSECCNSSERFYSLSSLCGACLGKLLFVSSSREGLNEYSQRLGVHNVELKQRDGLESELYELDSIALKLSDPTPITLRQLYPRMKFYPDSSVPLPMSPEIRWLHVHVDRLTEPLPPGLYLAAPHQPGFDILIVTEDKQLVFIECTLQRTYRQKLKDKLPKIQSNSKWFRKLQGREFFLFFLCLFFL